MNLNDEIAHLVTHAAHMATGDLRVMAFGRILEYDPVAHLARASIPQFSVVDTTTGLLTDEAQTPWLPLPSANLGDQVAPEIGAQCFVCLTDKGTGPGIIIAITHTDLAPALDPQLQPGEATLINKASKTFLKFFNSGEFKVAGQNGALFDIDKDGKVTIQTGDSQGQVTITLNPSGAITIQTPSNDITWQTNESSFSINDLFNLFNGHVHTNVQPGSSNSGPPATPMSAKLTEHGDPIPLV